MRVIPMARPNPALVRNLEHLLEDARSGRLQSLVYAGEMAGGEMTRGYSEAGDRFALIGALECLKFLLMEDIGRDASEVDPSA